MSNIIKFRTTTGTIRIEIEGDIPWQRCRMQIFTGENVPWYFDVEPEFVALTGKAQRVYSSTETHSLIASEYDYILDNYTIANLEVLEKTNARK